MNKKNLLWSMVSVMVTTLLSVSLTACGSNDEDDGLVDTPSISEQDPEGTVAISMGGGSSYDIGLVTKISIDGNNNFVTETLTKKETYNYGMGQFGYADITYHVEFASVGKVNGLSQVTTAPTNGWSKSIVVIPGTGYVARSMRGGDFYGRFTRLYVTEQNVGTVATVKYQTPFEVPFTLEKTSLVFTHTGTGETIKITNGTRDIKVAEKPEWCYVGIGVESAYISASKNPDPQPRTGKVVLKNSVCSATITVTQDVAPAE